MRDSRRLAWTGLMLLCLVLAARTAEAQPVLGPITRVAGLDGGVGSDVGSYCSLAQDGFGGQYLAYYDATRGVLRYARRPRLNQPWRFMDLDTERDSGRNAVIAVSREPIRMLAVADLHTGDMGGSVTMTVLLAEGHIGARLRVQGQTEWYEITGGDALNFAVEFATPYTGPDVFSAPCDVEFYMPAVAWQSSTTGEALKVAAPTMAGTFDIQRIDPLPPNPVTATSRSGYSIGLDVDTTGTVQVAWQDRSVAAGGQLRFAQRTVGGVWSFETADGTAGRGNHARLVTDNARTAVMLYRDEVADELISAHRQLPNDYFRSFVAPEGGDSLDLKYLPGRNSLLYAYRRTVDAASQHYEIRMALADYNSGFFGMAMGNIVTSGGGEGEYVAVAMADDESSDSIRVLHYDSYDRRLFLNRYDSATTSFSESIVLDGGYNVGRYVSAGYNAADDALYAAYYDAASGALKLGREDAVGTSTQYIDGFKAGTFSSIGVTSDSYVVAYHHDSEGSLHVARWPFGSAPGGPGATDVVVDHTGLDVGEYASLGVGPEGQIVVAYLDRVAMDLKLAYYNPADLQWYLYTVTGGASSPLGAGRAVGEWACLAVRGSEAVVSCYDQALEQPIYAAFTLPAPAPGRPALSFDEHFVGSPIGTGRQSSICFGASGADYHMAWFNEQNAALECGTFDTGGNLTVQQVEQGVFSGAARQTCIALNPTTNLPAIAYHDMNDGTLKFAEQLGANVWNVELLDNDGVTGQYPRLLFHEATGAAYLAYYAYSAGELRLLTRTGFNAWQGPYTLASGGRGLRPSLVIDSGNLLNLSFYDESAGDLLTVGATRPMVVSGAGNWAMYR